MGIVLALGESPKQRLLPAALDVPQPHFLEIHAADQAPAVGRKSDRQRRVWMAAQLPEQLSTPHVPESNRLPLTTACQETAVRRKNNETASALGPLKRLLQLSGLLVP